MKTATKTGMAIVLLLLASGPIAAGEADTDRCEKVKMKIRDIEARMRRGYTAAQGIRLEARLRKLKNERYRVCR